MRFVILGLLVGIATLWNPAISAYPDKPIRIIVPNPAGSNSDLIMRQLAPRLSELLKQPLVIDNRAGGGGLIANNVVVHAAPDGYTILFGTATNLTGDLAATTPYDPGKDFAAIGLIATLPFVLAVNNSMPVKSVRELVDYVSARPDKLAYATTIGGSFFAGSLFARAAGLKITAVAYNSGPQAIAAVLSGDINYLFYPYQALLPQISSNRLRALATTARTRPSWLPNVPTMIESGYPDLDLSTFVGLYAPLKTPRSVIDTFSRAMTEALKDPDL